MAFNRLAKKIAQQMPDPLGGMGGDPMGMPNDPSMGAAPAPVAPDPTGMGADPMAGGDPSATGEAPQQFTLGTLTDFIEQDPDSAMEFLKQKVPNAQVEYVDQQGQKRTTELWSLLEPENWRNADDETKGKVAGLIQENLPAELKAEENMGTEDSNVVPGVQKTVDIKASVEAQNEALKAFAHKIASALSQPKQVKKAFNRLAVKTAAGLPVEVYPLLDGHDTVDLRTHQLINNRDIVERNKAWGLKPTDLFSRLGIDYDGFWQTHIMDRFYPEHRDKDGNWVGGYINRRFEVDRNIPEFNNMQYRPGEKRKPARATLLEGKLEEARGGKAFNWVKAKSNRAVKTAQGAPFEQEKYDFTGGEDKVRNASDAEIEYALKDLKQVIDIQEKSNREGGHTPKLGYYWDEYHTYVGEKARRMKAGTWNPEKNLPAPSVPQAGAPAADPLMDLDDENYIDGKTGPKPLPGVGQPPLTASTKTAKACRQCGTAMLKGSEGVKCPACVKANADEEVREAALQKKK